MYIILASHGPMAEGTRKTAEMIAGPQEGVHVFGINMEDDPDALSAKLEAVIVEATGKGEEIMIFTDLISGTPYIVATQLMQEYPGILHITGMNVGMLVTVFAQKSFMSAQELYDDLKENKDNLIMFVNDVLAADDDDDDDDDD